MARQASELRLVVHQARRRLRPQDPRAKDCFGSSQHASVAPFPPNLPRTGTARVRLARRVAGKQLALLAGVSDAVSWQVHVACPHGQGAIAALRWQKQAPASPLCSLGVPFLGVPPASNPYSDKVVAGMLVSTDVSVIASRRAELEEEAYKKGTTFEAMAARHGVSVPPPVAASKCCPSC